MKKLFLILSGFCCLLSASAINPELRGEIKGPGAMRNMKGNKIERPATRADEESLTFGYCGDYMFGLATGEANVELSAAIEIPKTRAQAWKGCKITKVRIGYGKSSNKEVSIFFRTVLNNPSTDIYSSYAVMEVTEGWNEVTLSTPYEITGEGFFVGYSTMTKSAEDYPIGIDYTYSENEYGDLIADNNNWYHYGTMYGSVCIQIVLEGDNLPMYDCSISELFMESFVKQGDTFNAEVLFTNQGVKTANSATFTVSIDGDVVCTPTINFDKTSVPTGNSAWVTIENIPSDKIGANMPVVITLTEVNGNPDETELDNSVTGLLDCSDLAFDRNVLVEEFTGTWCGYCPRGIVGMKYMQENYANDGFIGIAVHGGNASEPMQSTSYNQVINRFISGFPNCLMDRKYQFDPNKDDLEYYFLYEKSIPSITEVGVTATIDEAKNVINVTGDARFAFDINNADYSFAFVLRENNVGPYYQSNYFSGGAEGGLEGWNNLGSQVRMTYDEVGREIVDPFGIANSLPTSIAKGQTYTWSAVLDPKNYKIEDCSVVAIVFNNSNYSVMNAAVCNIAPAGVENIIDDNVPTVYKVYNLQGVKMLETEDASAVNNLPAGIYVVNGKKVAIK